MKTIVYVDAFNLHYGALKGTAFRWLNPYLLSTLMLPKHEVTSVAYFTALLHARSKKDLAPKDQQMYHLALSSLPMLSITYGHYLTHQKTMMLADPLPGQPKQVEVINTEEKGTDVNLATQMVHDAHCGRMESAVIISNDSDFGNAIRICRNELNLVVGVLNPQQRAARTLTKEATFMKRIRQGVLAASQLPAIVQVGDRNIHRPKNW